MSWILLLLIGLTIGWALELLLDVLYWGRRNSILSANLLEYKKKLHSSQRTVRQFKAQVASLKTERDQLSNSLEEVDQWVETSMRRHLLDTEAQGSTDDLSEEPAVSITHATIATAKTHFDRTAGQIKVMVSVAREKLGRSWQTGLLNRSYCSVWALIGSVTKKVPVPHSCSINAK